MATILKPRRRLTHKFCPHCSKEINTKTYKEHRRLYFNATSKSWLTVETSNVETYESDSSGSSPFSSTPELTDDGGMYDDFNWDITPDTRAPKALDDYPSHSEETEYWMESDGEIEADIQQPQPPPSLLLDSPPTQEEEETKAVVWWIIAFVALFQSLHFIPERAISWLIKFLYVLLKYCGRFSQRITKIAEALPRSLYLRDRYLQGTSDSNFICRYVVCSACDSLYTYEQCIEKTGTRISSKACSSQNCNAQLLKQVISISGNKRLYPYKVFCYNSVILSLQKLLLRPGFRDLCESTRNLADGIHHTLWDIYHGKIWNEFLRYNGSDFLVSPYCYALMLNVDWFQPFEHYTYSVGVIYLVLLNLPRAMRYKRENIILVGIIPGPTEPHLTMNSYLSPLVSDLLQLWTGVLLPTSHQLIRAALLAVSCDLPAGRKVCGFLSHSANLGCSRCYCPFSEGFGSRNYSDFDRASWQLRSNERHRSDVEEIMRCRTKTQREAKESALGCRYSVLLHLPYFDPVHMLLIDPMHNLFLGSAKYVTQKIWIGTKILKGPQLAIVHKRLEKVQVPVDIGRLPLRIDTGSTFTAEQWMNWTIYLSIYSLHGLLSWDEIECWRHFVLACRRLCKRYISLDDVTVADALLVQFCKRMKRLYGTQFITPNMHLHGHLAACIRDYGPLHSFWLFSFERYNGLLGNQPTNNRAIEIQLMNRFLKDNTHLELLHKADSMPLLDEFGPVVKEHANKFDSVRVTTNDSAHPLFCEPTKYTLTILSPDFIGVLKQVYCNTYPQYKSLITEDVLPIPSSVRKFHHIQMNGSKLSSLSEGAQTRVPYVIAKPVFPFAAVGTICDIDVRPAQIQYFFKHSFSVPSNPSSSHSHLFAVVKWPQVHPHRQAMGKPVEVWCKSLFEPTIENVLVPVENIVSRVAIAYDYLDNEEVLAIIPLLH